MIFTRRYKTINDTTSIARATQNESGFTGRLNHPNTLSTPADVSNSDWPIVERVCGSWLIIPAKITRLIPLPTPCSVMSSPSHINKTAPAVIAPTATIHSIGVGVERTVVFAAATLWRRMKIKAID
ncbi:hypothetical protein D3C73_1134930 [compost metagenome]